jgi:hypothetical protein
MAARIGVGRNCAPLIQLHSPNPQPSMASLINTKAPDFRASAVMPDGTTKEVSLGDYSGQYVAMFFYPKDFTFV